MSEWTADAKAYLGNCLKSIESRSSDSEEGGKDFAEDIWIHVETEIQEKGSVLVTKDIVEAIVVRVLGYDPLDLNESIPSEEATEEESFVKNRLRGMKGALTGFDANGWLKFWGWMFGVLLPLVTLLFEAYTGASASGFFDPIPSIWHIVLIALVPGITAWNLLFAYRKRNLGRWNFLSLGVAMAISIFYTIPFAVLMPFAVIGIIYFGIGFLPLAPLLALLIQLRLMKVLRTLYPDFVGPWKRAGVGILMGIGLILLAESPRLITSYGMSLAESSDHETSVRGVSFLRILGSNKVMLDACMPEFSNRSSNAWTSPRTRPERAREIYYRVKGHEYYADADKVASRRSKGGVFNMRSRWDWYLGDQTVGRPVDGLSLQHSRIDAVVEPDAAHGYMEWTMEFENASFRQAEARCLLELPPGAAISRVNLWINGEPREAAFSAKSKVIEAYQRVVQRRRDPLLVTTKGKDHVLAQCFPIPGNGGKMKIRLGVVYPIELDSRASGAFVLPRLSARNFAVGEDVDLPIWIDSDQPISSAKLGSPDHAGSLRTELSFSDLEGDPVLVRVLRNQDVTEFWSNDPYSNGYVTGQLVERESVLAGKKLIVVLDSSQGLKEDAKEISKVLEGYEERFEKLIVVDELEKAKAYQSVDEMEWRPRGGQDNTGAIESALRLSEGRDDVAILWIHTSQARQLVSLEGLNRQLNRRRITVPFYSLKVGNGSNTLLDGLEKDIETRSVTRFTDSAGDDLQSFLEASEAGAQEMVVEYSYHEGEVISKAGEVGDHAARLWALGRAKELFYESGADGYEASAKLAASHQLVTPATGAVVLENEDQYKEAGLDPVEKGTTASIPDSGRSLLLLLIGLVVLLGYRRFRGADD